MRNFAENNNEMRNFENWETQDLEIAFGLNQVPKMPLLDVWLNTPNCFLSEYETARIENLRQKQIGRAHV